MHDPQTDAARLTSTEKTFLKEVARQAVAAAVHDLPPPDIADLAREADVPLNPRLNLRRGAFVTLSVQGRLRGCIGYIEGHVSLVEAVARNGRAAALEDPRFEPVTSGELSRLEYEISALTPLQEVARVEDIVIGRHGILLEKRGRRAVFLPQVAPEQGWDLKSTLGHLALKAGLEPGDWHENTRFQVFEAEVF